jgi:hypothetical protein
MLCRWCAQEQVRTEIPPTQFLCPRCYRSDSPFPRPSNGGRPTKNLLVFIADEGVRTRWMQDIQNYLQPDEIAWSFAVETAEEFFEVTSGSMNWHLLIVESEILDRYPRLLETFSETHPRTLVIALFDPEVGTLPSTPPVIGAIMLRTPEDIDAWLVRLHQAVGYVG